MIELSSDPQENVQIIGKAKRWRHWDSMLSEMEGLVELTKEYPLKMKKKLQILKS